MVFTTSKGSMVVACQNISPVFEASDLESVSYETSGSSLSFSISYPALIMCLGQYLRRLQSQRYIKAPLSSFTYQLSLELPPRGFFVCTSDVWN